jgi:hypothetical protein
MIPNNVRIMKMTIKLRSIKRKFQENKRAPKKKMTKDKAQVKKKKT